MKNLKKALALVVSCLLVFGLVATAATPYPDVPDNGSALAEAVKVISALKIVEGDETGNYKPDGNITRGEMAKVLCTMVNSGAIAQTATNFTDVPSSHWASGYIYTGAAQLGFIDGMGDGTFRPDEPVTYEQVIKLMTCAVNYKVVADSMGGYPTGYMMIAAEKLITKNAPTTNSAGPATRGTVAILIYNTINAPIMKQTKFGSVDTEWQPMDGTNGNPYESLLNTKLNAYKVEGTVFNTFTSQVSNTLKEGFINYQVTNTFGVDGTKLGADQSTVSKAYPLELNNIDATGTGADSYLYYLTTAYLQENDFDEFVVLTIVPKIGKNVEYKIDDASLIYDPAEDASRASSYPREKFSLSEKNAVSDKYVYSYWENSREDARMAVLEVESTANIIWNGQYIGTLSGLSERAVPFKADGTWQENVVRPLVGSVKLVDSNNDGTIDIIDSRDYKLAVVDSVQTATKRVSLKQFSQGIGGSLRLSTDDSANLKSVKITLDGEEIEYTDLQEFDVLNICTNDFSSPTFFDIIVTRKTVEGVVNEKNPNNNSFGVKDYDESLRISKGLNAEIEINIDDEGIFYLDMNGNVAYADMSTAVSGNFAYLYYAGEGDWKEDMRLRMFTKDGKSETYTLSSNVKINGVKAKDYGTGLTKGQIATIFGDSIDSTVASTPAVVADVLNVSKGTASSVTAKLLLMAITGTEANGIKCELTSAYKAKLANDDQANRMVNYILNASGEVTSINIAKKDANADRKFSFVDGKTDAKWIEKTGKFSGMKSITEDAVVFIIPGTQPSDFVIADTSVFRDEELYSPFLYNNTSKGGASIILLTEDLSPMSDVMIFSGYVSSTENSQNVKKITYWKDGNVASDKLVAYEDVDVEGVVSNIAAMKAGDVFTVYRDSQGYVTDIHVIFSPGTSAPADFKTAIDITRNDNSDASFDNWALVGDEAKESADNKVYFGMVAKITTSGSQRKISLVPEDGLYDGVEIFNVPNTMGIQMYNSTRSLSQRVKSGVAGDIYVSGCAKAANGDLIMTEKVGNDWVPIAGIERELTYAFVYTVDDDVVQVEFITYY